MSRKNVTILLLIIVTLSLVAAQNESISPATGKASSAGEADDGFKKFLEDPSTIKGVTITDKGGGGAAPLEKPVFTSSSGKTPSDGENRFIRFIFGLGSLSFLFGGQAENQLCGFLRILLALLVFTILYFLASMIPGLTRGVAITISIILAILVAIFTPCVVLLAWGTSYATIFAFVVIFGPVLAGLALLLFTPTPNRRTAFLKLVSVLALMWLVYSISYWAKQLGG
ncbi:hypothetical protein HY495_02550 [Candidatus Woesearchaeota archaeon]|nr:hypothetical protein [Candidatus Woesearchaeota archaeon]